MFLCENTGTTVKIGPVVSRDGKAFGRKRLFQKEVMISINDRPLSALPSDKPIPCDLDGYYDVALPPLTPGRLKVVVILDGYPLQDFNFVVISRQAYSQMFTNDKQSVIAENLPIENGHVVTDPNMIVGIDLEKVVGLNAQLDLPRVSIGSVGKVQNPHIADLSGVMEAVQNAATTISQIITDVSSQVSQVQNGIGTLDTETNRQKLDELSGRIDRVKSEIQAATVTQELIHECVSGEVKCLATSDKLNEAIVAAKQAVDIIGKLNIPTVEDMGGKLDLKDGKVKIAVGSGPGELDTKDGMVRASDVEHKSGYSLAKDGLNSVKNEISVCIKKEIERLLPKKPKNKPHIGSHR